MSIYQSGWNPRGTRKAWDKTSMTTESTKRVFEGHVRGRVVDACAWFDEGDALRILVADTDDGKRVTYRKNAQGFSITTEPRP